MNRVGRIGILADTHIIGGLDKLPEEIRRELCRELSRVDLIMHAGDVISVQFLRDLESLKPVVFCPGNCDPPDLCSSVNECERQVRFLEFEGWKIGLTHGHIGKGNNAYERAKSIFADGTNATVDVVVFGHSHHPVMETVGRTLYFNPGSPTVRRREVRGSYGILELSAEGTGRRIQGTLIFL